LRIDFTKEKASADVIWITPMNACDGSEPNPREQARYLPGIGAADVLAPGHKKARIEIIPLIDVIFFCSRRLFYSRFRSIASRRSRYSSRKAENQDLS
jgi:hypothetical protein